MKLRTLVTGLVAVALSMSVASCAKNDAQPIPATSTWPSGITEAKIKASVSAFLSEYKVCLYEKTALQGSKVRAYCASHNSHAIAGFAKSLPKNGAAHGVDPVTCLKEFPDSFSVTNASVVQDGEGYAGVMEMHGSKTQSVFFQVKQYSSYVQVISNTCQ
jgi:hypothetical protein